LPGTNTPPYITPPFATKKKKTGLRRLPQPYNPRYARQPRLETIPEVSDSRRGSGDGEGVGLQGIDVVELFVRDLVISINFSHCQPPLNR
jgi:hypothetical protein